MYYTTTQIGKLLGVTRHSVINWVKSGDIMTEKTVGGHRRIPKSEVDRLLQERACNQMCSRKCMFRKVVIK